MPEEPPELLTTAEVAKALRVSTTTVTRWVSLGLIRAIRLPTGILRFRPEEVDRILQEGTGDP